MTKTEPRRVRAYAWVGFEVAREALVTLKRRRTACAS